MRYQFTVFPPFGGQSEQIGTITDQQRRDIEAVIDGRLSSLPVEQAETLRDRFAAAALIGIGNWTPNTSAPPLTARACYAYQQADAMLRARKS